MSSPIKYREDDPCYKSWLALGMDFNGPDCPETRLNPVISAAHATLGKFEIHHVFNLQEGEGIAIETGKRKIVAVTALSKS